MSSSRAPRRLKDEDDDDKVKKEDEDFESAQSAEEISDDSVKPVKKEKRKEAPESSNSSNSKGKRPAPDTFEAFEKTDGVTLHLVIKDAKGDEIRQVKLKKHQFTTGSYGWNLSDRAILDDGEGGSMSVGLYASCVYQSRGQSCLLLDTNHLLSFCSIGIVKGSKRSKARAK